MIPQNTKPHTLSDFELPQDTKTERIAVVGLLSNPHTIVEVKRFLKCNMFSDEKSRKAYAALLDLHNEGKTIDLVTMHTKIGKDITELTPYLNEAGSGYAVIDHCLGVRDYYIRRSYYLSALEQLNQACNPSVSVEDLMKPKDVLTDVTIHEAVKLSDAINELGEYIEESMKAQKEGKTLRTPTGFSELDKLTYSGFSAGQLIILAARPSVGKTAVMLQMAKAAGKAGQSAMVFTKEMQVRDLAQRFVCSTGLISPKDIALANVDWGKYEAAAGKLSNLKIYLNDKIDRMDAVLAEIALSHKRGKCDIAFIDYLGLFIEGSRKPLHQEIGEYTQRIKQLAMSLNIPIVLLCQLNRASASEKRPPEMHDLRDSGNIEADADIVLMLEKQEETETAKEQMKIWVRKNRNGKKDLCIVTEPNGTYTEFQEIGVEINE